MTKGFLGINKVRLPREVASEGHLFLRYAGLKHSEGIVLWVGVTEGTTFHITDLLIPHQTGIRTSDGVCAVIEGPELRRIGLELYQAKRQLFAQVHSHPTDAYHSETDDRNAIVTTMGGMSLVVPDFATRAFDLDDYATYRLAEDGAWNEMHPHDVRQLIEIVEA